MTRDWDKTIFLGHAREDKTKVHAIYKELVEIGLHPWLDIESLKPGENWDSSIREAIARSSIFLACLSRHSIDKNGYVQKELRLALSELEKKAFNCAYFYPLMLDSSEIPSIRVGTVDLADYHAVRYDDKNDWDKFLNHLCDRFSLPERTISFELVKSDRPEYTKKMQISKQGDKEIEQVINALEVGRFNQAAELLAILRFTSKKLQPYHDEIRDLCSEPYINSIRFLNDKESEEAANLEVGNKLVALLRRSIS